jgi:hypothetical protein
MPVEIGKRQLRAGAWVLAMDDQPPARRPDVEADLAGQFGHPRGPRAGRRPHAHEQRPREPALLRVCAQPGVAGSRTGRARHHRLDPLAAARRRARIHEPRRPRDRLLHAAGELTRHARQLTLHLPADWPRSNALARARSSAWPRCPPKHHRPAPPPRRTPRRRPPLPAAPNDRDSGTASPSHPVEVHGEHEVVDRLRRLAQRARRVAS